MMETDDACQSNGQEVWMPSFGDYRIMKATSDKKTELTLNIVRAQAMEGVVLMLPIVILVMDTFE